MITPIVETIIANPAVVGLSISEITCEIAAPAFDCKVEIADHRPDAIRVCFFSFPISYRIDIQFFRRRPVPEKIKLGHFLWRIVFDDAERLELRQVGRQLARLLPGRIGQLTLPDKDGLIKNPFIAAKEAMDQWLQVGMLRFEII